MASAYEIGPTIRPQFSKSSGRWWPAEPGSGCASRRAMKFNLAFSPFFTRTVDVISADRAWLPSRQRAAPHPSRALFRPAFSSTIWEASPTSSVGLRVWNGKEEVHPSRGHGMTAAPSEQRNATLD